MKISLLLILTFSALWLPPAPNLYLFTPQINDSIFADTTSYATQRAAWMYSFVGAYEKALWAFDQDEDTLLNERGYPLLSSGYYTQEPQFGNLVREALRIGYELFPYETQVRGDGKERKTPFSSWSTRSPKPRCLLTKRATCSGARPATNALTSGSFIPEPPTLVGAPPGYYCTGNAGCIRLTLIPSALPIR